MIQNPKAIIVGSLSGLCYKHSQEPFLVYIVALVVYSSSFKYYKVFSLKMKKKKKNHQKEDARHLKNNKNSSHGKRYKKEISSKVFFIVIGYLKRSNETPTSI